jgi:hypothetical protein
MVRLRCSEVLLLLDLLELTEAPSELLLLIPGGMFGG